MIRFSKFFVLLALVAAVGVFAACESYSQPVGQLDGFSSTAAYRSFSETGDMSHGADYAAIASVTMRTGEGVKLFRTYGGCSVGCSSGCSVGCSYGCSYGCSQGCSIGCN